MAGKRGNLVMCRNVILVIMPVSKTCTSLSVSFLSISRCRAFCVGSLIIEPTISSIVEQTASSIVELFEQTGSYILPDN